MKQKLAAWTEIQLKHLGIASRELVPIVGDAGFRQYFRLATEPPLLAVYGPPDREKHKEFVAISEHWREHGLNSPQIFAADLVHGFLLIEDFGAQSLAHSLQDLKASAEVSAAYASSLRQLKILQTLSQTDIYKPYDKALLLQEMMLFNEWFFTRLLGLSFDRVEEQNLIAVFEAVIASVTRQPAVIVHRDFHCRNIQILANQEAGLIDFQDAVWGPVTYDLVSLLKDCYQCWPKSFVVSQALAYREQLPNKLKMASAATFMEGFHLMGWQRHMKVLGIFARLALRDNKVKYLDDLSLVLAYTQDAINHCSLLNPLAVWFEERVMTSARQQSWYHSLAINS